MPAVSQRVCRLPTCVTGFKEKEVYTSILIARAGRFPTRLTNSVPTCFDRLQGKGGANGRLSPHQRNAPRPLVVAGVAGIAGFALEPHTLVAEGFTH